LRVARCRLTPPPEDNGDGSPKDIPHTFLVKSQRAEYLTTFSPAGAERFFPEVAPLVVAGQPPPSPTEPDQEQFARIAASYGIEIVGPPPTLD
jgi:hypothetical protein